ncbi:MAG: sodium/solute symporter, partial [Bacteroidota bacterium]
FVGLKPDGGMQWLTYEFAVPIAMLILMVVIIPPIYKSGVVSIYELLEKRFDRSSRLLISLVFLVSRAFGTGVMVYTMALILESVLNISFTNTILLVAVVTMIYSYMGGMKAVVYGDVVQMIVLFVGIIICLYFGLDLLGGWDNFTANLDRDRLDVVDFSSLGFNGDGFGFFPMLFGGLVLYMSYYGCDQSQAQRILSAASLKEVKNTLLVNGLMRFPITLIYCIMGLVLGTFAMQSPEFLNLIPEGEPDKMIPVFIVNYLPHGIIGILVIAILSAAMSSLSSAINSLSAVSVEDFLLRGKKVSDQRYMQFSRGSSIFWGIFCLIAAFFAGDIADTVIEAINKIGSVFFGPIIGMFLMALLMKKITTLGANVGLIFGVGLNIFFWLFVPDLFWFWWNFVGLVSTVGVAYLVSTLAPGDIKEVELPKLEINFNIRETYILVGFFVVIVLVSVFMPYFF